MSIAGGEAGDEKTYISSCSESEFGNHRCRFGSMPAFQDILQNLPTKGDERKIMN